MGFSEIQSCIGVELQYIVDKMNRQGTYYTRHLIPICYLPVFTLELFEHNMHVNWWMGSNPNLTTEFVSKYLDKPWNWGLLTKNGFELHPRVKKIREVSEKNQQKKRHKLMLKDRRPKGNRMVYQKFPADPGNRCHIFFHSTIARPSIITRTGD